MANKVTVTGRFIGGGLFKPRSQEDGKNPRYSACVVLDEGEKAKIEEVVQSAKEEKWGNKPPSGLQTWAVRTGDDSEYEVSFEREFINPKSSNKPKAFYKRDGVYIETKEEDLIYPGCYVAASVGAYGYDGDKAKGIKPGITLNLRGVMFIKHGERLGDRFKAENEFEGFESDTDVTGDEGFLAA